MFKQVTKLAKRKLVMLKLLFLFLLISNSLLAEKISNPWDDKSKGLVWGSLYGDAFGGPYEFLKVKPHRLIKRNKRFSKNDWRELEKSVELVDYKMKASPYGAWVDYAPAGTITDDSRHKLIFWSSFENRKTSRALIAKSYIEFFNKSKDFKSWLNEYVKSAYYFVSPQHSLALPKERLWGGMPTQAGQMIYLMNALNFKGLAKDAYINTYENNIFDNGEAMDYTSAVVSALAHALSDNASWESTKKSLKSIDPYLYSKVPFVERKVLKSIELAEKLVKLSRGNPQKLFLMLEENLSAVTWWEADTAFTISYAFLEMTKDFPLAGLALAREFGHDTDSYAQLIGAFIGAIYGEIIFDKVEVSKVKKHVFDTYGPIFKDFE